MTGSRCEVRFPERRVGPLSYDCQESAGRTLYKQFTSVSPDLSGHVCQTDRAPMLVGTPLADKVSAKVAVAPPLLQRLAPSSCERHITLSPDRGGPVYTLIHVVLSLVGIFAGLVVAGGLVAGRRLDGWTGVFLVTTVATNVTGFGFPFVTLRRRTSSGSSHWSCWAL